MGTSSRERGRHIMQLSDESEEEEAPEQEKFLAFVAPHVEEEDSYSEHSDDGEELKEAYKTLYVGL
jgi:hypothetical protein